MRTRTIVITGIAAGLGMAAIAASAQQRRRSSALNSRPDPWAGNAFERVDGQHTAVRSFDGTSLATVDSGGSGPPILLIHGLTANLRFWSLTSQELTARGHRVIAMDQRGHGGSSLGPAGMRVEALGADVAAVLEALDLRDTVVVGHSMGGIALQSLLVRHTDVARERVRHAVICSSLARMRTDLTPLLNVPGSRRLLQRELGPRTKRLAALRTFGDGVTPSLLGFSLELLDEFDRDTFLPAIEGLSDFDLRLGLEAIEVPTTVVCGTHDRVTPARYSREIIERVPDATDHWFEGAGHVVPLERVEEFVEIVDSATR